MKYQLDKQARRWRLHIFAFYCACTGFMAAWFALAACAQVAGIAVTAVLAGFFFAGLADRNYRELRDNEAELKLED